MELYLGVFVSAFLAATLLPIVSEAVVLGVRYLDQSSLLTLWAFATTGNTLGACVNWWLGRYAQRYKDRPWFPVPERVMQKTQNFYNRYGLPSLLLAWTPWLGDPLTLVAGLLRVPFLPFVLLVGLGKGARYAVILFFADELQQAGLWFADLFRGGSGI